jgi:hypothetical protein
MSSSRDPEGREHVDDEYITYNRHKERRPRLDFDSPFPPNSKEEEEAHTEAERSEEHEAEREVERMLGDRYERPEGSGKAPMELKESFMQVLNNMVVSQQAMTQSLAQMAGRLAIMGTQGTQAPHALRGRQ